MAEASYITAEGKRRVAELLAAAMRECNLTSQAELAEFIYERTGLSVPANRIQRLMKGHYDDGTVKLLLPIVKAEILKWPNGQAYTFDDLVDVLCEFLDPETGERKDRLNVRSNGRRRER